jgi:hypothetical protein
MATSSFPVRDRLSFAQRTRRASRRLCDKDCAAVEQMREEAGLCQKERVCEIAHRRAHAAVEM